MSSRPCNYCLVRVLRAEAKKRGATVHLVPGGSRYFPHGTDVFVVEKGEKLDASTDSKGNHGKQWKMWAAEISEMCAC